MRSLQRAIKCETEQEMISGFCHSKLSAGLTDERSKQMDSYKSGRALAGHVRDAHKGIEDPKCPACKEIRFRCGL